MNKSSVCPACGVVHPAIPQFERPRVGYVAEVHPRPDDPSCHVCGAVMVPTGWKCLSCGTTTEPT